MDEVKTQIQTALTSNAGKMTWQALVEAVSPEYRRLFPKAVKELEQTGYLKRQVTAIPGHAPLHEVIKL